MLLVNHPELNENELVIAASRTSHRDCHAFLRNARNDKPGLIYKGVSARWNYYLPW